VKVVDIPTADDAMVVVADVVAPAVVEVDAWLTQFTVVVIVSTPPAIQAGWNSRPNLFACASVNTIVSDD
jgi:hypothetical protein